MPASSAWDSRAPAIAVPSNAAPVRVSNCMARLDEIAEGLSSVLAATQLPEPLFVDMMNHSPADITFLIRAVVDACERLAAPLALIRVDEALGSHAARSLGPEPLRYEGIPVELADSLGRRIEFYRLRPGRAEGP